MGSEAPDDDAAECGTGECAGDEKKGEKSLILLCDKHSHIQRESVVRTRSARASLPVPTDPSVGRLSAPAHALMALVFDLNCRFIHVRLQVSSRLGGIQLDQGRPSAWPLSVRGRWSVSLSHLPLNERNDMRLCCHVSLRRVTQTHSGPATCATTEFASGTPKMSLTADERNHEVAAVIRQLGKKQYPYEASSDVIRLLRAAAKERKGEKDEDADTTEAPVTVDVPIEQTSTDIPHAASLVNEPAPVLSQLPVAVVSQPLAFVSQSLAVESQSLAEGVSCCFKMVDGAVVLPDRKKKKNVGCSFTFVR
jgi:hypothetical protein